ncbi:hypothetical protein K488DRAFT_81719 [Vararia minispora EC-137]|uniref:Uncharacterized protein n=1 Tax=Vararia minispora EC-137 TaxID=1314806 RepID=A0ACB8QYB9_9AGAM|nr:hypothetical protein K488DRAFT_81719 [Vararia minispora EC-137]
MSGLLRIHTSHSSPLCRKQLVAYLSLSARFSRHVSSAKVHSLKTTPLQPTSEADSTDSNPKKPRSSNYGKLEPYDLAQRLVKLCKDGQLDEAVATLKRMPLAAQNIKVWNTLITNVFEAKKYKLAYSLYTDLRRRGFKPSLRTFTTMLSGYHEVDDWKPLSAQLKNVHNVYDSLVNFLEDAEYMRGAPPDRVFEMRVALTMYFDILVKVGQFDRVIEAFGALPGDAHDGRMYATYFRALTSASSISADEVGACVAAGWEEFLELHRLQPQRFVISDLLCYHAFSALTASTDVAHHTLAFDIAREQLGLCAGVYAPPPVEPHPKTLAHILRIAALLGAHDIVHAYADVVQRRHGLRPTLRLPTLYTVLTADRTDPPPPQTVAALIELLAGQSPSDIARASVAVEAALNACWHGRDFDAAARVLAAYQLVDVHELFAPPASRPEGALCPQPISMRMWMHVIRAALAAQDDRTRTARRCLTMVEARADELLKAASTRSEGSTVPKVDPRVPPLVQALTEAALGEDGEKLYDETRARWQRIRNGAYAVTEVARKDKSLSKEEQAMVGGELDSGPDELELK